MHGNVRTFSVTSCRDTVWRGNAVCGKRRSLHNRSRLTFVRLARNSRFIDNRCRCTRSRRNFRSFGKHEGDRDLCRLTGLDGHTTDRIGIRSYPSDSNQVGPWEESGEQQRLRARRSRTNRRADRLAHITDTCLTPIQF